MEGMSVGFNSVQVGHFNCSLEFLLHVIQMSQPVPFFVLEVNLTSVNARYHGFYF